ncbi:MAG TPA: fucose isomerase [Halanaerobiales bacterium]|nr:fucose isomerase [Halanaerobiales bacterium]
MKVGMYSLFSPIHDEDAISQTLEQFVKDLSKNIEVEEINDEILSSDKKEEYDLITVFVKTGGTENIFKEIFDKLEGPVILVATSLHNSLAASMEILSWVKSQDRRGKILHGKPTEIAKEMENLIKIKETKDKLANSRLGLIGEPSDWLIDSHIDKQAVQDRWGLEVIEIPIQEVLDEYHNIHEERAQNLINEFTDKATSIEEPSENDLMKAAKVYFALKNIVNRYDLNSLTIRCFDLVTELETTGCLALSLLNNEGIVAGCEGDIPATVSMMITYYLTGNIPFMANPVSLNIKNNKVKFAHCTVATKSVNDYIIRSHFETGIGVGIQGEIKKGNITVFKLGGKKLDHIAFQNAQLINNLNSEFACRTQVLLDFDGDDISYFLKNPIGNHHILVEGNHYEILNQFVESLEFDTILHW